jgi:hypothetical protein
LEKEQNSQTEDTQQPISKNIAKLEKPIIIIAITCAKTQLFDASSV